MQIDHNILITYGGVARKFNKGEYIFREGDTPCFFYQVVEGKVKLFSTNAEGKDFIQGFFKSGDSFGEPPLLLGKTYPSTAQAGINSTVIKIPKEKLLNILNDYPEIASSLIITFAERIYDKAVSARILISHTPEEKIVSFLDKFKGACKEKLQIPYTRQQIADFTGLRVETVIRTLTRMSKKNMVSIINHKIYY